MDIKKIKTALYNALKNDIAIEFYNINDFSFCFSFYPLDNCYNGLVYIRFSEEKLAAENISINFQYLNKTKKLENTIKKIIYALDGFTKKQLENIKPIFDFYHEKATAIFSAKYSIKINLYTDNEDIKYTAEE